MILKLNHYVYGIYTRLPDSNFGAEHTILEEVKSRNNLDFLHINGGVIGLANKIGPQKTEIAQIIFPIDDNWVYLRVFPTRKDKTGRATTNYHAMVFTQQELGALLWHPQKLDSFLPAGVGGTSIIHSRNSNELIRFVDLSKLQSDMDDKSDYRTLVGVTNRNISIAERLSEKNRKHSLQIIYSNAMRQSKKKFGAAFNLDTLPDQFFLTNLNLYKIQVASVSGPIHLPKNWIDLRSAHKFDASYDADFSHSFPAIKKKDSTPQNENLTGMNSRKKLEDTELFRDRTRLSLKSSQVLLPGGLNADFEESKQKNKSRKPKNSLMKYVLSAFIGFIIGLACPLLILDIVIRYTLATILDEGVLITSDSFKHDELTDIYFYSVEPPLQILENNLKLDIKKLLNNQENEERVPRNEQDKNGIKEINSDEN